MDENLNLYQSKKIFLFRNLLKNLRKKSSFPQIWCIVLHPVEYQIPFYSCLYKKSKNNSLILFMDDFSTKPFKTLWGKDRIIKVREANKPQNYNFSYFFSKNLSPNRENTYLINRINFDIILGLIIYQPKIAIITSFTSFTNLTILLLSPFLKTKICLRAEGGLKGRPWLRNRKKVSKKLIDWLINRADYFFYSCEDNKEYFQVRGVKNKKLNPLLSSCDSNFFSTVSETSKRDYEYFLIASKLEKRKNIIEAILGYKKYIEIKFNNAKDFPRLLIAGMGQEYSLLKEQENNNIIFCDYVHDIKQMRDLIQGSLGLIISSLYDPSPKIVNETLASSKPVLCRDTIGTAGDLIEHKKNGYIYNPKNKEDIVSGYSWIEKNKFNKNVKNFCTNKSKVWSPEQNADSVIKLFKKVLKHKK